MAKKTTGRKTPTKKTTARKPAAKKPAARRKTTAKKPTTKKTTSKKAPAKKTSTKKTTSKKTPAKKTSTKKTPSKKTSTKKTSTKKTSSKKAPAKKTTTKKAPTKKAPTKKTSSKKTTTKKTAKKSSRRTGRSVAEVASSADADAQGYVFIKGRRVRMISTKGKVTTTTRRSRADKSAAEVPAQAQEAKKPIKTKLGRKELDHYRNLLLIKRAELAGDLTSLEAEALRSSGGNLSHMPIHMADIGSDTYEQDFMLGLAENERRRMREIDDALRRITDRTYGVCQMTGKPIPKARLEAKPWAKYTIEAARQLEQGWSA